MLFHAKKRVLINGRPLLDQDNNVIAAVVTLRDISKYKQLEQELKKQKKYRKLIGFKKAKEGRRNKGRRRL
jgi:sensor histidine kinase regulating citrate/malate metabolism